MKRVALGSQGLTVSAQGFGAMSMSGVYGESNGKKESIATLNLAVDLGINFFDTAESYGPFENERLMARALGHRRDEIVLATEFALDFSDDGRPGPLDGRPEHIRRAVERSLRHLGTDVIDPYYMHRVDPNTPIEETTGGMAELVAAGKVRYVGLVAYSPIGRGLLSGSIRDAAHMDPDDPRRVAWVTAQGSVPIPGTKRRGFLTENAAAAEIVLTGDELSALASAVTPDPVRGARYSEQQLASTNR